MILISYRYLIAYSVFKVLTITAGIASLSGAIPAEQKSFALVVYPINVSFLLNIL
jgi:hypothetical protein